MIRVVAGITHAFVTIKKKMVHKTVDPCSECVCEHRPSSMKYLKLVTIYTKLRETYLSTVNVSTFKLHTIMYQYNARNDADAKRQSVYTGHVCGSSRTLVVVSPLSLGRHTRGGMSGGYPRARRI